MSRDARSYLQDVIAAAENILSFVDGVDEVSYASNKMMHSAVERKFEIIGEALSQLARTHFSIVVRVQHYREIIAFRNLLIHGYKAVRHDRVFEIARRSLPVLKASVQELLEEISEADLG